MGGVAGVGRAAEEAVITEHLVVPWARPCAARPAPLPAWLLHGDGAAAEREGLGKQKVLDGYADALRSIVLTVFWS